MCRSASSASRRPFSSPAAPAALFAAKVGGFISKATAPAIGDDEEDDALVLWFVAAAAVLSSSACRCFSSRTKRKKVPCSPSDKSLKYASITFSSSASSSTDALTIASDSATVGLSAVRPHEERKTLISFAVAAGLWPMCASSDRCCWCWFPPPTLTIWVAKGPMDWSAGKAPAGNPSV